jgi:hypothetical protein
VDGCVVLSDFTRIGGDSAMISDGQRIRRGVYSWRLHGSGEAAWCRPLGRGSHPVGASHRPRLVGFRRSETCPAPAPVWNVRLTTVVTRTETLISPPVLSVLGAHAMSSPRAGRGTGTTRWVRLRGIFLSSRPPPRSCLSTF